MFKNNFSKIYLFGCLFIITACGGENQSKLAFKDTTVNQSTIKVDLQNELKKRADFAIEKERVWKEINDDAKTSFADVKEIFTNKCMNCHDASFKLPLYGKIFAGINPVHKHQEDGLKAFNFEDGFPFKVPGNPPQISILKSIRNSIVTRTMPIKSFTFVYPKKKINEDDEKKILAWIDPIIEKINDYETKFNTVNGDVEAQAKKVIEMKCFRCHANGNSRGGFGGMENTDTLMNGKYVSKEDPEQSKLFTTVRDGQMPPNKMDSLTVDEIYAIRDWIEKVSKKVK